MFDPRYEQNAVMTRKDSSPVAGNSWRAAVSRFALKALKELSASESFDAEDARFGLSALQKSRVGRVGNALRRRLIRAVHACEWRTGGFGLRASEAQSLRATYYGLLCCELLGGVTVYAEHHKEFVMTRAGPEGLIETSDRTPSMDAIYYGVRALQILGEVSGAGLCQAVKAYAAASGGYCLRPGEQADLDPTYEALSLVPGLGRSEDIRFIRSCRRSTGYARRPDACASMGATFWAVRALRVLGTPVAPGIAEEVLAAQGDNGGFSDDWSKREETLWATYAAAAVLDGLGTS